MTMNELLELLRRRGYHATEAGELLAGMTLPPSELEWVREICAALEKAEGRLNQVVGAATLYTSNPVFWAEGRYVISRPDANRNVGFCAIGCLAEVNPDRFKYSGIGDLCEGSTIRAHFLEYMVSLNDKGRLMFGEIAAAIRLLNNLQTEGEPA